MSQTDHHIGDLDAGVVDVVLHVHPLPGSTQQAHKGVAENGVAQMTDVRSLVGIDAGVLDQGMKMALLFRVSSRAICCAAAWRSSLPLI